MSKLGLIASLATVAVVTSTGATSAADPVLSRWDRYWQVGRAVDDFIRCTRAAKTEYLGQPTEDRELQMDWPPYLFCGAIVHWDARKERDLKSCLLQRSFGEELSEEPSREHNGGKTYSVSYNCRDTWGIELEVQVHGDQANVLRFQDFDKP